MYKPKTFADEILLLDFEVAQRAKIEALIREQTEYKTRITNRQNELKALRLNLHLADQYCFCKNLIVEDINSLEDNIKNLFAAHKVIVLERKCILQVLYKRRKKTTKTLDN